MKNLLLFACLLFSTQLFAGVSIINESFVGRNSNDLSCRFQHRQLDYSYPELFISTDLPNDNESLPTDAHLLQAFKLDFLTYEKLIHGSDAVPSFQVGSSSDKYIYKVTAENITNSESNQFVRQIKLEGITQDGNQKSFGTILVKDNRIASVTIWKQAKTRFLGRWQEVFRDTCFDFTKI